MGDGETYVDGFDWKQGPGWTWNWNNPRSKPPLHRQLLCSGQKVASVDSTQAEEEGLMDFDKQITWCGRHGKGLLLVLVNHQMTQEMEARLCPGCSQQETLASTGYFEELLN